MSIREQVSQTLLASGRPMSAYDVLKLLEPQRGKLAPTTIYRALNALVAEGRVHRIESLNAYVACPSSACAADHAVSKTFTICDDCGAVAEHHDEAVTRSLDALAGQSGFRAARRVIEIHGQCGDCGGEGET